MQQVICASVQSSGSRRRILWFDGKIRRIVTEESSKVPVWTCHLENWSIEYFDTEPLYVYLVKDVQKPFAIAEILSWFNLAPALTFVSALHITPSSLAGLFL